ncbi:phosphoribosylaminoimidazolesuccinocarboxamide synthase [Arcanobacterium bovis]|uniref:Phosphoribosylaminoimidazole-succinocarboxamide synthase n=1 Tax=Arcanobacterium bovis TaxID=2529275 RepID=A0A4V2KR72_9ACTO|nr:phosphoribosylaminoimidazolesuccinocarboxamide synthase [Arcanobacterium bovis]TBW22282.1 phosphoribosylaminoimidazolesuccinocarboxamide synthase [Arcanobacterium bovis]
MKHSPVTEVPLLSQGKVRDLYDLDENLLIVVTDRVSAFDVVFDEAIPDKGGILNSISAFWFKKLEHIIPNHMISVDPADYPEPFSNYAQDLARRSMLVRKLDMVNAECIVRGYLEGSALKSYQKDGTINGMKMPAGLKQGDALPEPIFTPSTKEENGHDINISVAELRNVVGTETAEALESASLQLFTEASDYARERGILLADTKFEFGYLDGVLTLGDEAFTPDSSRFWAAESWEPGHAQASFDKQFLREWLETLDWDKTLPAPTLPQDVIANTAARYRDAYERLTGTAWNA